MLELPLVARARAHASRVALRADGVLRSYEDLLNASSRVAAALLDGRRDLEEARVAFMAPASFEYVAILWGIWRAGGIAVPVSPHATAPEIEHVLGDSDAAMIVATGAHAERLASRRRPLLRAEEAIAHESCDLPEIVSTRRAMILYTSGTTSKPKGVVSTHANLQAQIETLVEAWEWRAEDRIPLFLPLHHIHGIINVLSCALWSGALVDAFPRFESELVLPRVASGDYTLFMAVPTLYAKLVGILEAEGPEAASIRQGFSRMRLMVSGSAALPASLHRRWAELTGQSLLERYGMTETGMMISNPLHGERRAGTVGQALPGVMIRLRSEHGETVAKEDEPGEVQARGPGIFREYWNLPAATAESFEDGWFRTGDMAVIEDGYYRILGRLSVDIIKSGGYKLSALEIEAALLDHPAIRECAVVGLEDDTWGQTVAIAVVLEAGVEELLLPDLQRWGKDRLSDYKLPRHLLCIEGLPRNAMGKVAKREVTQLFGAAR
jgi:malonyl-CoA/methylmalonyl-CoA synthetase